MLSQVTPTCRFSCFAFNRFLSHVFAFSCTTLSHGAIAKPFDDVDDTALAAASIFSATHRPLGSVAGSHSLSELSSRLDIWPPTDRTTRDSLSPLCTLAWEWGFPESTIFLESAGENKIGKLIKWNSLREICRMSHPKTDVTSYSNRDFQSASHLDTPRYLLDTLFSYLHIANKCDTTLISCIST